MIHLYIDDGVKDRGHRTNILNPEFLLTGMAVCAHASYGEMLVVEYAASFEVNEMGVKTLAERTKE